MLNGIAPHPALFRRWRTREPREIVDRHTNRKLNETLTHTNVIIDMEVNRKNAAVALRLTLIAGLAVILSGCVTFRDAKESFSQLNVRKRSQLGQKSDPDDFDAMGERSGSRLIARDFQPKNFMATMRVIAALDDDQAAAQKVFDEGRALYDEAADLHAANQADRAAPLFQRAANRFREAAAHLPNSAMEEDALFMQGEAYFFADEYVMANRAYEGLISKFSGTSYLDQSEARRFSIAQYWLKTSETKPSTNTINLANKMLPTTNLAGEARRILHRIRLDDPTGKLSDDATMALGSAFFRAGRYQEAADAFDDLRKSYPGSPHQFNAHMFELKALLETYAGPDYDGAPLEKADKLLQAMVRLFPNEVEQQKEYLASEGSRVRNMLADRDYKVGQFYESKGENRAAGIYYAAVADRFKDTDIASVAQERIAVVAEKEPYRAQQAGWFTDLFPEAKSTRPLIPGGSQGKVYR